MAHRSGIGAQIKGNDLCAQTSSSFESRVVSVSDLSLAQNPIPEKKLSGPWSAPEMVFDTQRSQKALSTVLCGRFRAATLGEDQTWKRIIGSGWHHLFGMRI